MKAYFLPFSSSYNLENELNKFLENFEKEHKIINVNYSSTYDNKENVIKYSVLILYN